MAAAGFGAVVGSFDSYIKGRLGEKWNRQAQQRDFDFQERMSNTQYQRATADLKAAGLNRVLAVTGGKIGGGAGVPSGSKASVPAPRGDVVNSARMGSRIRGEQELLLEQAKTQSTVQDLNDTLKLKAVADAAHSAASAERTKTETEYLKYGLPAAKAESELDQSPSGQLLRVLNRAGGAFMPFLGGGLAVAGARGAARLIGRSVAKQASKKAVRRTTKSLKGRTRPTRPSAGAKVRY